MLIVPWLIAVLTQVQAAGPVDVAPDRLTEVTIAEPKPPGTRTLAGRVVDTKGSPIATATVFQSGDAPARTETTSDADGRFSLPGVAEASTFVFARAKGFRFAGRSAIAGATEVTFHAHPRE